MARSSISLLTGFRICGSYFRPHVSSGPALIVPAISSLTMASWWISVRGRIFRRMFSVIGTAVPKTGTGLSFKFGTAFLNSVPIHSHATGEMFSRFAKLRTFSRLHPISSATTCCVLPVESSAHISSAWSTKVSGNAFHWCCPSIWTSTTETVVHYLLTINTRSSLRFYGPACQPDIPMLWIKRIMRKKAFSIALQGRKKPARSPQEGYSQCNYHFFGSNQHDTTASWFPERVGSSSPLPDVQHFMKDNIKSLQQHKNHLTPSQMFSISWRTILSGGCVS